MLQSCPAPNDSMEMMTVRKEEQFSWKVGVKLFLCFWLRTGVAEKRGIKSWNQMEKQAMNLAVWCSAFRERAARPQRSSVEAFSFWKTHTPHTDSRHHRTLSHTGGLTDGSLVRETSLLWRRVCVSVWGPQCDIIFLWPGESLGVSIVEKGDIYLITAGCMLAALDIIDIGLHTPEACVISAASFEVRHPKSQNVSSHAISARVCPTTLTGHTITDTAGKLVNTRRMPACHTE